MPGALSTEELAKQFDMKTCVVCPLLCQAPSSICQRERMENTHAPTVDSLFVCDGGAMAGRGLNIAFRLRSLIFFLARVLRSHCGKRPNVVMGTVATTGKGWRVASVSKRCANVPWQQCL